MSNTSDHQQSGGDLKLVFFDSHCGSLGAMISSCVMPEVLSVVVASSEHAASLSESLDGTARI
jgi:hypothetical protein